jgi:hypothetical protein
MIRKKKASLPMDRSNGQINLNPYAKGDREGCVIISDGERG